MISLFISFAVLIMGYLVYGRVAEKIFSPDDRKTPATFMTAVSTTYILMAKEGFKLDQTVSYIIGAVAAALIIVYLIFPVRKNLSRNASLS